VASCLIGDAGVMGADIPHMKIVADTNTFLAVVLNEPDILDVIRESRSGGEGV
jgi:hypothetical protein